MDIKTLISEYLEKARLMQVATSQNDQPWACSVYFAYDSDFNLYWLSTPQRKHSLDIEANEKVAGTIVLPHNPGDKVRGIQFQGVAKRLVSQEDIARGLDIYATRMHMRDERKQNILQGKDNHVVYQISPSLFVLFDEVNFADNPRQEYKIQK